jgi:hypothetical protein
MDRDARRRDFSHTPVLVDSIRFANAWQSPVLILP